MKIQLPILLLTISVCLTLGVGEARAQQVPLHDLYNLNPSLINPAFSGYLSGTRVNFNAKAAARQFQEAPKSFMVGIQSQFLRQKIGVGARVQVENQGVFETFYFDFMPSYKLRLNTFSLLSFGLDAGFINRSYSSKTLNGQVDANDPVLFSDYYKSTNLRVGFGLAYISPTWDLGLSFPQLVESGEELNSYFDVYVAYSIFKNKGGWYLKPSVLFRNFNDATQQASFNALSVWNNAFLFQLGYTTNHSASMAAGLMWDNWELIYNTNIDLGKDTNVYGSIHEIMLNFNLKHRHKGLSFVKPKMPRLTRRF